MRRRFRHEAQAQTGERSIPGPAPLSRVLRRLEPRTSSSPQLLLCWSPLGFATSLQKAAGLNHGEKSGFKLSAKRVPCFEVLRGIFSQEQTGSYPSWAHQKLGKCSVWPSAFPCLLLLPLRPCITQRGLGGSPQSLWATHLSLVPQIKRQLCFLPLLSSRVGNVPQKWCQGLDPVLFLSVPGYRRAPCASVTLPGHASRTGICLSWEGAEQAARSAQNQGTRT